MVDVGICMAILSVLRPVGIFYVHLVLFVVIWYRFSRFGMLYREKSGNPAYLFLILIEPAVQGSVYKKVCRS
jgi:hypothetical protein